jgi:hypothetical protein
VLYSYVIIVSLLIMAAFPLTLSEPDQEKKASANEVGRELDDVTEALDRHLVSE